jgi:hypothetical protein
MNKPEKDLLKKYLNKDKEEKKPKKKAMSIFIIKKTKYK